MIRESGHLRAGSRRRVRTDAARRSTRRALILAAASWPALVWAGAAFGQAKKPPVVIGWLAVGLRETGERSRSVFKKELAALGWKEGSQVVFEERFADGKTDRLPALAEELAAKNPAVIVAYPVPAGRAAAKAAPKTPVVVISGDPVTAGLVKSYARPGDMITGISSGTTEHSVKYLELLLAAAPNLRRVGFFLDLSSANLAIFKENAHRSATQYKVEARFVEVARPEDVDPALARLAKEGVQALVTPGTTGLAVERQRIVKFALAQRWPVVGNVPWAEDGALLGYGPDVLALSRRAAHYVDRILKGTKPGDLPIEMPTKFELVINIKTAKALGLTMPPSIMVQATRVIE